MFGVRFRMNVRRYLIPEYFAVKRGVIRNDCSPGDGAEGVLVIQLLVRTY